MSYEQALAKVKEATEALNAAERGVSHQRFYAQNCMPNTLAFAQMMEHTARQNWLRAHENFTKQQAPTPAPKPVTAPVQPTTPAVTIAKPVTVATKPATVIAYETAMRLYREAEADVARARVAFQAADKRERQAHFAVVAAAKARHDANMND